MALGSGRAAACGGLCLAAYALHLVCLREGSLREEAPLGQASLAAAAAAAAPVPARSVRGFSSGPAGSRGAAGEGAVAAVPASEARGPAGGGRGRPRGNGTLGSLDVERVAWLHPPKAGSSFVNTLFGYACRGLKNDEYITRTLYDRMVLFRIEKIPEAWNCPFREDGTAALDLHCSHKAVSWNKNARCNQWDRSQGNFVMILRQPEQRILSGFAHDKHGAGPNNSHLDVLSYAKLVQGCQVRMLLGSTCYDRRRLNESTITGEHIGKAIKALDEGFAFVGILEEIELSVCLFHAMFGGACRAAEFVNIRPSYDRFRRGPQRMQATADHNVSVLSGWTDEIDRPLYEHAVGIVHSNMDRYGVHGEACRSSICPCCPEAFPADGSEFAPPMGP